MGLFRKIYDFFFGNNSNQTTYRSYSAVNYSAASELRVSANKKVETLRKEFNSRFPYLKLWICYSYTRNDVARGGTIYNIPGDRTIGSVRRGDTNGEITITGNKKVKTLENEFDAVYGLYVQVGMTGADGKGYYTTDALDDYTLSALNEYCQIHGFRKGVYK